MPKSFTLLALFFFALNISFSSLPPRPYYKYYVSGFVKVDSLVNKENFAVQLYGMQAEYMPAYQAIKGIQTGTEQPVALTDSSGFFYIAVGHYLLFDSLKAGVVRPDKPVIYSPPYFIDPNRLKAIDEYYEPDNGHGCTSCSTTEPMETRVAYYEYYLDNVRIEIK